MRAIGVMAFDGPEALQVVELPERHAGPGEVRVRVHAAALNPTDTYHANGYRAELLAAAGPPPYVPGMDVAGVLDELGEGVDTGLAVGDHVMAIVIPRGSHGGYSESLVPPAESVVAVPSGPSDVEACTLPMNGLTARLTLDRLALAPGETLLVTGAAGAYGGYVVQLAKGDGLRVIADASEADEQLVRDLSADVVVRRGPDIAARLGEQVAAVADGSVQNAQLFDAVRDGGGAPWLARPESGSSTSPAVSSTGAGRQPYEPRATGRGSTGSCAAPPRYVCSNLRPADLSDAGGRTADEHVALTTHRPRQSWTDAPPRGTEREIRPATTVTDHPPVPTTSRQETDRWIEAK